MRPNLECHPYFSVKFFVAHAPFDRMEPAHLLWMLERMSLAYYPEGEVIISPEQGEVQNLLVIKQGLVHAEQNVAQATDTDAWMELVEGECFPLGALLAHRPVASIYRAGSDIFVMNWDAPTSVFCSA